MIDSKYLKEGWLSGKRYRQIYWQMELVEALDNVNLFGHPLFRDTRFVSLLLSSPSTIQPYVTRSSQLMIGPTCMYLMRLILSRLSILNRNARVMKNPNRAGHILRI